MKILDLFNEYNLSPEMTGGEVEQPRTEKDRNTMSRIYKAYIVSKDFGWIKWLVDNDKIDFENQAMQYAKEDLSKFLDERKDKNGMSDEYAMILMLLAIQDEPIEFLCSILK